MLSPNNLKNNFEKVRKLFINLMRLTNIPNPCKLVKSASYVERCGSQEF